MLYAFVYQLCAGIINAGLALVQMANDIRLLPYLVQLIIGLVASLHGGAILLSSAVRQCSDKLAL